MKDDGSVHVFEAVITGMLVLTAILFMTALSKPDSSESSSGLDLSRIADDTLEILLARPADDPATFDNRLEEIVDAAMKGDGSAAGFINDVLPTGTRYLLRLDNGVAPLTLLPSGSGPATSPRNAEASEAFLVMDWNGNTGNAAVATVRPGQTYPTPAWTSLESPAGGTAAPGDITWVEWWAANSAGTVPDNAPYGLWKYDDAGPKYLYVALDASVAEPVYPVYGVQLVVWPGA